MNLITKIAAITTLGLGSCCASAGLIGSQITGELYFNGGAINYFDPVQGYVLAGSGNAAGVTVTVGAGREFGYEDGSNTDIADFTDTQLLISDNVLSSAGSWVMRFTSVTPGLFQGISVASDIFSPALITSLSGNTITIGWAGTFSPGAFRSSINVSTTAGSVPEPSVLSLLALTGLGLLASRKAAARN